MCQNGNFQMYSVDIVMFTKAKCVQKTSFISTTELNHVLDWLIKSCILLSNPPRKLKNVTVCMTFTKKKKKKTKDAN